MRQAIPVPCRLQTAERRHYSNRIKLIRPMMPARLRFVKARAPRGPPGASRRTTFTPRSCVCRISSASPGHRHARARVGNLPEMLDDEAVQRFRAVDRKLRAEPAVQRAQRRQAVDDDGAVGRPPVGVRPVRRLGREIADDLLDDVLDRDQPDELAVLVDDEPEPLAVVLELLQLGEQRRAGGDEIGAGAGSSAARPSRSRRRAAGARPASGG